MLYSIILSKIIFLLLSFNSKTRTYLNFPSSGNESHLELLHLPHCCSKPLSLMVRSFNPLQVFTIFMLLKNACSTHSGCKSRIQLWFTSIFPYLLSCDCTPFITKISDIPEVLYPKNNNKQTKTKTTICIKRGSSVTFWFHYIIKD